MAKFVAGTIAAALPLLGILMIAAPSPAQADDRYPWCAVYSERSVGATNCGFVSLAQCRATVSGAGGDCFENPAYQPQTAPQRKQRVRQY